MTLKQITATAIGFFFHLILTKNYKTKLIKSFNPEFKLGLIEKFFFEFYYYYFINRIYLKETDPDKRFNYQKICLGGFSDGLYWAKQEDTGFDFFKAEKFSKIYNIIKQINDNTKQKILVIQVGSSTGREIAYFAKKFSNIQCLGIDIYKSIIKWSSEKYSYNNLKYIHLEGHQLDKIFIENKNKKIIIFSEGSIEFMQPEHLEILFKKIQYYRNIRIILSEGYYKKKNNKLPAIYEKSFYNGGLHFTHDYEYYAKKIGLRVIDFSINSDENFCFFYAGDNS